MKGSISALGAVIAIALVAPSAQASEAMARKMAELLPAAPSGWTSAGPKTQTIKKGNAKGGMAFQIYQAPEKKSVLVRLVENSPPQFKKAIANPGEFKLKPTTVGERKAAVQEGKDGGTLIVVAGQRLAMIEWKGAASRADAARYAEAIDLDELEQLQ